MIVKKNTSEFFIQYKLVIKNANTILFIYDGATLHNKFKRKTF